jgi:2-oxoglutarate dehydrogenase E2 component (dihydrolipoamide succinyltransferase)
MAIEIKIPGVGESVQEALLAEWFKQDGDVVQKDEPLFVIETDKVTLEVAAETDGVLKIITAAETTVAIGTVVGSIEPSKVKPSKAEPSEDRPPLSKEEVRNTPLKPVASPVSEPEKPSISPSDNELFSPITHKAFQVKEALAPSVRRLVAEKNLDVSRIKGTGPKGRISKGDVLLYLEQAPAGLPEKVRAPEGALREGSLSTEDLKERKPMTPIRKRIAQRLLEAKQNTAMLTTVNEIDMGNCMDIRSRYKEIFKKRYNISLGFMSFFVSAAVQALKEIPEINAFLDGDTIVYHHYQHIGVAVGSERGLVVPVLRHAEKMNFARIEHKIMEYVTKIKENRLELADLEGGTFTISNGGIYGSLLSTPILNTPQSGILGMHKIEKRPVVVDDQIVIRPMMYVALSYDHRIVDGKGAVTFLKRVKEFVENPERILLEV